MDLGDMMDKAKEAAKNVSDDQIEQAKNFSRARSTPSTTASSRRLRDQAKKLND